MASSFIGVHLGNPENSSRMVFCLPPTQLLCRRQAEQLLPSGRRAVYGAPVACYGGQVSVYGGQVSCYGGQVSCYAGQVSCYSGQVSCYCGQVSCYAGQVSCYAATVAKDHASYSILCSSLAPRHTSHRWLQHSRVDQLRRHLQRTSAWSPFG